MRLRKVCVDGKECWMKCEGSDVGHDKWEGARRRQTQSHEKEGTKAKAELDLTSSLQVGAIPGITRSMLRRHEKG